MQINVNGIVSPTIQQAKCQHLNRLMRHKQLDIVCIQEWSANIRKSFKTSDTSYRDNNGIDHALKFPIQYFPGFKVHHIGTETAILYRQQLNITTLPASPNYDRRERTKNCHITSIILHSDTKDIGIHSVYNCPRNPDCEQFFRYPTKTDKNLFAGDFNLQNVLWGSNHSTRESNDFIDGIDHSGMDILNANNPSYTRVDPNGTKSCLDLTIISNTIKHTQWNIFHNWYKREFSDHIPVFTSIEIENDFGFSETKKTWNLTDKIKWYEFTETLEKKVSNYKFSENPSQHTTQLSHT